MHRIHVTDHLIIVTMSTLRRPRIEAPPQRPRKKFKRMQTLRRVAALGPETLPSVSIEEYAKSIDTTLTAEQQKYVDGLKKKISGGHRSVRCKLVRCYFLFDMLYVSQHVCSGISRSASTRGDPHRRAAHSKHRRERPSADRLRVQLRPEK